MHEEDFACACLFWVYKKGCDKLFCNETYGNELFSNRLQLISLQLKPCWQSFYMLINILQHLYTGIHMLISAINLLIGTHPNIYCIAQLYYLVLPDYQNKGCLTPSSNLINFSWECECVCSSSVCFGFEKDRPSSPWQTIPGILYKLFICTSSVSLLPWSSFHLLPWGNRHDLLDKAPFSSFLQSSNKWGIGQAKHNHNKMASEGAAGKENKIVSQWLLGINLSF